MPIKWNESAKLNNMSVRELKRYFNKYPHTNKRFVHECDTCGKSRNLVYNNYNSICRVCKAKIVQNNRSDEHKKNLHDTLIERSNDPEYQKKMRKIHDSDEFKYNCSIGLKKSYAKMDDPGQQICLHHYIYDFNDLTKYTIEVTRSEHTAIHNNLRRAELEVPCINIMVDD